MMQTKLSTRKRATSVPFFQSSYDIEAVKKDLKNIKDFSSKKEFLLGLKADYLGFFREKNLLLDSVPFDQQLDMELNYLKIVKLFEESNAFEKDNEEKMVKLKIKAPVLLIGLAFVALLRHRNSSGQKYISVNPFQMAVFLAKVLEYQDGQSIENEMLFGAVMSDSQTSKHLYRRFERSVVPYSISHDPIYSYNIDAIENMLETLSSSRARITFLNRVLTNYMQHRLKSADDFVFLQQIQCRLATEMAQGLQVDNNDFLDINSSNFIVINGPVNVLMTFFYDLVVEIPKATGIQFFTSSKKEIIHFIMRYFRQKNGKNLSRESLRTLLTPCKTDKRCSMDKRVKIRKIIKFVEE